MNANEVAPRIAELTALIEEKEADLSHKVNRRREHLRQAAVLCTAEDRNPPVDRGDQQPENRTVGPAGTEPAGNVIAGRRIFLDDAELSGLLREERKYNEGLRKRRAAAETHHEPLDVIAHYDHLIYKSDARLLILYEKNR